MNHGRSEGALRAEGGHRNKRERATVTKLVGAPGSGKTTSMLRMLRDELRDGTDLADILFMTFTRAAREDVEERLRDIAEEEGVYDADADDDEHEPADSVRTLHGAALKACLDASVITLRNEDNLEEYGDLLIRKGYEQHKPYFSWFFQKHFPSVPYDADAGDPIAQLREGDEMDAGTPAGNRIMALYDHLVSADIPLEDYYQVPMSEDIDLADSTIHDVLVEWEAFKDRNDLIQDDDYVKAAVEHNCPPPARVLFIDEFQDLSPLQNALYEMWRDSGRVDHIYVGGDPHQAIYGFRGATPTFFNETTVDETIRDEVSKRCPREVIEAAKPIAEPCAEHDVSEVGAMTSGGHFEHVTAQNADELAALTSRCVDEHGEVFLLARTRQQGRKMAWALREGGLPYRDVSPSGDNNHWRYPLDALLAACRAYEDDRPVPIPTLALVLDHVPRHDAREDIMDALDDAGDDAEKRSEAIEQHTGIRMGGLVPSTTYRQLFTDVGDRGQALARLLDVDAGEQRLITTTLDSRSTHNPDAVRVGTFHAAKGLGAACVLISPAYSNKQLGRYHDDRSIEAEERRLYYTAVTRAKDTALVVHEFHGGEEFPPLAR